MIPDTDTQESAAPTPGAPAAGASASDPPAAETTETTETAAVETTKAATPVRDGTDTGVEFVPTDGPEPQGPEDALGPGPKRGDYRGRQPEGSVHMTSEEIPEAELRRDDDGLVIADQPRTRMVVQNHHTHNIGDVPGAKGGVTTLAGDMAVTR